MVHRKTTKKKPKERFATLFLRDIPRDVKSQFKAWCARRDLSMTEKIVQIMRDTVAQEQALENVH